MFLFHWYQSLQKKNLRLFSIGIINWYHMFWFLLLNNKEKKFFGLYPFVDDWQKGGEVFVFYMHVYLCSPLISSAYLSIDVNWYQRALSCLCIVLISRVLFCLCIVYWYYWYQENCFVYACLWLSIHCISIVYYYAWVKGELLWSLTLIQAYITPWVLSSSKRGRLLAQRPFTLVLMMINSCSFYVLIILWYLVSDL